MTQPFPRRIVEALPPDNEMATGVVTAVNPLTVNVRGASMTPGTVGSYIPSVGDPVQMLRQDATWLVLGASVPGADATNSVSAFNANTAASGTASATYVNVMGALLPFTKRLNGSRVRVDLSVSAFITVAVNTKPRFGFDFINLSGGGVSTRVDTMEMLINPLSTHTAMSGGAVYSGIAAGSYTVQLLWLRVSGAGTLNINSDDWVSFIVAEVA